MLPRHSSITSRFEWSRRSRRQNAIGFDDVADEGHSIWRARWHVDVGGHWVELLGVDHSMATRMQTVWNGKWLRSTFAVDTSHEAKKHVGRGANPMSKQSRRGDTSEAFWTNSPHKSVWVSTWTFARYLWGWSNLATVVLLSDGTYIFAWWLKKARIWELDSICGDITQNNLVDKIKA